MRFIWPLTDHYITRGFNFVSDIYVKGDNGVRLHAALDLVRLQGDTAGRDTLSVADSTIAGVGWDIYSGFFVAADLDEGGWRVLYRHLDGPAPVAVGQRIKQGQVIGYVGSTGLSSGPHLHVDLWHKQPQDPTAHAKVGWWAHNPELYLGQEDNDMTPEQEKLLKDTAEVLRIVQAQVNQLLIANADFRIVQGQVNQLLKKEDSGLKRGDKVNIKGGTLE